MLDHPLFLFLGVLEADDCQMTPPLGIAFKCPLQVTSFCPQKPVSLKMGQPQGPSISGTHPRASAQASAPIQVFLLPTPLHLQPTAADTCILTSSLLPVGPEPK